MFTLAAAKVLLHTHKLQSGTSLREGYGRVNNLATLNNKCDGIIINHTNRTYRSGQLSDSKN